MRPGPFALAAALAAAALPLAGCSSLARPDEITISAEPARPAAKQPPTPVAQAPAAQAPAPAAAPAGGG